jgi:hypothetical protein
MNLTRTTLLYVIGSLLLCAGIAADSDSTFDAAPHVVGAVVGINAADRSISADDSVSRDSVGSVAPRSPSTVRDVSAQLSASHDSWTIGRSAFEVGEQLPLELDSYDANVAVRRRWSRRRDRRDSCLDPALM